MLTKTQQAVTLPQTRLPMACTLDACALATQASGESLLLEKTVELPSPLSGEGELFTSTLSPQMRLLDFVGKASLWALLLTTVFYGCTPESKDAEKRREADKTEQEQSTTASSPEGFAPISALGEEQIAVDAAPLANLEQILSELKASAYHNQGIRAESLKIAVLDNGFQGHADSIGKRLPPDTQLMQLSGNPLAPTSHGLKLAEIAYAIATGQNTYDPSIPGPQILLVNTNGYSNFVEAVDTVIAENVDIVLYAQVWEYGGNFDGSGFINREVNRALASGILWLNAAGNMGKGTWHGGVELDPWLNVKLPHRRDKSDPGSLRLQVRAPNSYVKIVLSWNDFRDDKDYHTPQDLDLYLLNSSNIPVASATKIQSGSAPKTPDQRYSAHAREIIKVALPVGSYSVRIKAKSKNFDKTSRLRITVDSASVDLIDRIEEQTVLIPADNMGVVTIGAIDVDYTGRKYHGKPELLVNSKVVFEDGLTHYGSSAATAIAAGAMALYSERFGVPSKAEVDRQILSGNLIDTTTAQRKLVLPTP